MIINKKIKKKERKVPNHKVNYGLSGKELNDKNTWEVRIISTKEHLEYYRTQNTAQFSLKYWRSQVFEKCEVVKNEEL